MPQNTPRGYTYPLYGDAASFPAQIQDFAQDVDADVASLVTQTTAALNRPSARISTTDNQLMVPSTPVFCTFTVEEYDNAAMANLGVNNDRLTFTQAGIYLLSGDITFAANGNVAAGGRKIDIWTSTGNEVARDTRRGASNEITESNITFLYSATAGSFVRLQATHTSGGNLHINIRSLSATKVAN